MIVYPAIDIRDGKAVRLVEGDFDQETVFDADPVEAARRWQDAGAEWIHIVDLDGARHGDRPNRSTIERIRAAVTPRLQLGGGMRSLQDLAAARESGIDRMVIGSAAVSNPDLVPAAVRAHGEAIAIGIDARNGMVATQGWTDQTSVSAFDLARQAAGHGVQHIIFTDISRDGRLQGPNLESLGEMIAATPASVIASGGIGSLEDIRLVAKAGATGVIVGAALYHRRFELADAFELARNPEETP